MDAAGPAEARFRTRVGNSLQIRLAVPLKPNQVPGFRDIDIFVDPFSLGATAGKRAIDRELKRVRDVVGAFPALRRVPEEGVTIVGGGPRVYHCGGQRSAGARKGGGGQWRPAIVALVSARD